MGLLCSYDRTRECQVVLVTTNWFRLVISYAPHHLSNKEITSGFPVEFDELYFVATYLYASKSILCFDVQCLVVLVTFKIRLAIDVQCINMFSYIDFNAFCPFLRELCCVAYRLAASVIVNKSESNWKYGQKYGGALCRK